MSFLTLAGLPIPVADASRKPVEIGSRTRAASGTPVLHRRTTKEEFEISTAPLAFDEFKRLDKIVRGEGDSWSFEDTSYPFASSKGRGPSNSADGETLSNTAGDGFEVLLESGDGVAKRGDKCLALYGSQTNQLDADTSKGHSGGSYTAIDGATLSHSSAYYWTGSESLRVQTSATANGTRGGVKVTVNSLSNGDRTCAVVHLRSHPGSGSQSVRVRLIQVTSGDVKNSADGVTIDETEWTRVELPYQDLPLDANSDIELHILEETADSELDFLVDGMMIVAGSSSSIESVGAWVEGGQSSTAEDVELDAPFVAGLGDVVTFCFWLRCPYRNSASDTILSIAEDGTLLNIFRIKYISAAGSLALALDFVGPLSDSESKNSSFFSNDGGWHLMTVTVDWASRTFDAWADTTQVATSTSFAESSNPDRAQWDLFTLGGTASSVFIDDLIIVPYAMTSAQIANIVSSEVQHALLPNFVLSGDIVNNDEITVQGEMSDSSHVRRFKSGSWSNNSAKASFTIREV